MDPNTILFIIIGAIDYLTVANYLGVHLYPCAMQLAPEKLKNDGCGLALIVNYVPITSTLCPLQPTFGALFLGGKALWGVLQRWMDVGTCCGMRVRRREVDEEAQQEHIELSSRSMSDSSSTDSATMASAPLNPARR